MGGSDAETVAEGYLNDCLSTFQRIRGPRSVKTIQLQEELCRLMLRTDRYKVLRMKASLSFNVTLKGTLCGLGGC